MHQMSSSLPIAVPGVDVGPSLDEDPGGLLVSRPDGPLQTAPPVLLLIVGVGPVGEQKPDELRIPVFPGREHDRRASVRVSGMDVHSTGPQQHPSDRVVIRIEPLTGNKQRGVRPQFDSGSGSTPCSRRYRVTRTIRLRTARMS